MKRTISALIAAATLVAAPAAAQQHETTEHDPAKHGGEHHSGAMHDARSEHGMHGMHGTRMEDGMRHCPGMAGGQGAPHVGMLLQHADALELDAGQVRALETVRDETHPVVKPHMEQAMEARAAAAEALAGERPDLDAYEAALSRAADHMVAAHTAMARSALKARRVLTEDQREALRSMPHGMAATGHGRAAMKEGGMCAGMHGRAAHTEDESDS